MFPASHRWNYYASKEALRSPAGAIACDSLNVIWESFDIINILDIILFSETKQNTVINSIACTLIITRITTCFYFLARTQKQKSIPC